MGYERQNESLPRTEAILAELLANGKFLSGEHVDYHLTSGLVGIELGADEFDAAYHDLEEVDFTLDESLSDGGLYVPAGLAVRPLLVAVSRDATMRSEHPEFRVVKQQTAKTIGQLLMNSVPQTDPIRGSSFTDVQEYEFTGPDDVRVQDRRHVEKNARETSRECLSFVLSDFSGMHFTENSLGGLVAVKINHRLEREMPSGIGPIQIAPGWIVDTNKRKEVAKYNKDVHAQHLEVIDGLKGAGAEVVSVQADPSLKYGFDIERFDTDFAEALEESTERA